VRETNDLIILGREGADEEWQAAVARYEQEYGFEWLEHAARVKDPGGPGALIMPFFDEAKNDPRWQQYEAKFGL
jgi:hypothetical protein